MPPKGSCRAGTRVNKTRNAKTVKVTQAAPNPPIHKKKKEAGLCEGGAQKIVVPLITDLDAVIANKGDWCDGNHFAPARALLQSWLDEKTGTASDPPSKLNKLGAKTTFIDPIIGHLTFLADNKDWCDGARFGEARKALQAWADLSTEEQLCTGGASLAINLIVGDLRHLIANKGTWCDGNRFGPALDLLVEWLEEQDSAPACG